MLIKIRIWDVIPKRILVLAIIIAVLLILLLLALVILFYGTIAFIFYKIFCVLSGMCV